MICERCQAQIESAALVTVEGLTLDRENWQVHRAGREILLTALEFRLVEMLARFPGRVVPRERIWIALWGDTGVGQYGCLNVLLCSVRSKLGAPTLIHTLRGRGLMLRGIGGSR